MDKLFEITFLDEAFEFLKGLDRKHYEKIIYNIRKAQTEHDPELFKKLNNDIWDLELYTKDFNTDYLPFGTKLQLLKFWLFRHTDLSKNEARFPTTKFKKQSDNGQNILRTNN